MASCIIQIVGSRRISHGGAINYSCITNRDRIEFQIKDSVMAVNSTTRMSVASTRYYACFCFNHLRAIVCIFAAVLCRYNRVGSSNGSIVRRESILSIF